MSGTLGTRWGSDVSLCYGRATPGSHRWCCVGGPAAGVSGSLALSQSTRPQTTSVQPPQPVVARVAAPTASTLPAPASQAATMSFFVTLLQRQTVVGPASAPATRTPRHRSAARRARAGPAGPSGSGVRRSKADAERRGDVRGAEAGDADERARRARRGRRVGRPAGSLTVTTRSVSRAPEDARTPMVTRSTPTAFSRTGPRAAGPRLALVDAGLARPSSSRRPGPRPGASPARAARSSRWAGCAQSPMACTRAFGVRELVVRRRRRGPRRARRAPASPVSARMPQETSIRSAASRRPSVSRTATSSS